ncbi:MAG TPA: glycosyltransferase family 2 protein [Microbacteriaceae bacterium]|nr:glycosyltransferase family 2 protein [Microbacteriaceae bacterium]
MVDESERRTLPGVSYVMPVLNEVEHVGQAIDSLLAQDYEGPFDVTLAVGDSDDGTDELLARRQAQDERIVVVRNEPGSAPAGLNRAIRASRYPVVVRVDAHSVLPPDYTRIAVETMLRTGADNVGGVMDARGETPFEQAVAAIYGSRLGLGGTRLHRGGVEGPAETVYLGVFRRESLVGAGLYDEGIRRGEDWELNRRIRQRGGLVWFTPRLRVLYRPRSRLSDLAWQFFSTGVWRGELVRRFPTANGLRYWAPPALVLALAAGIVVGLVGALRLGSGTGWLLVGFVPPVVYLAGVVAAAAAGRSSPSRALWFLVALPTVHTCWGVGFFVGVAALARDLQSYSGRRTVTPFRPGSSAARRAGRRGRRREG